MKKKKTKNAELFHKVNTNRDDEILSEIIFSPKNGITFQNIFFNHILNTI